MSQKCSIKIIYNNTTNNVLLPPSVPCVGWQLCASDFRFLSDVTGAMSASDIVNNSLHVRRNLKKRRDA